MQGLMMATVTVSVPDQMKGWIEEQAKSGLYGGASDYIRDLIRKDQEDRAEREALIQALKNGEESPVLSMSGDELHRFARKKAGLK